MSYVGAIKLEEVSKQAEKKGHRQWELEVVFKVPQVPSQATSASAHIYTFQASGQHALHSG